MNILFVLYGDFGCNSANPLVLYARELSLSGHSCAVAVPSNLETVCQHENVSFRPILYCDVLAAPYDVFPDGRRADVIHACTPREVVRSFITSYMTEHPTPLVIYLEDNESWISTRALDFDEATLVQRTEKEIAEKLPDALSHPFLYEAFIGLADAVAVIQDKLKVEVPPWVKCKTVMIGIDLQFFSPRPADHLLRMKYGVADGEKVIVYHGGLNRFVRPAIETLCRAVGLISQQGFRCRLLRTGPVALDFLDQLPPESKSAISDLGLVPKCELPNLLSLADVFVQPGGIDAFEDLRLPGKLPEFLAMGRPVVLPDVNIAHLFRDDEDAVLLRTGSAEEIAEKCVALFSDPLKANMIGQAGRLLAEKYFDVRSQAYLLEDVYKLACDTFNPEVASEVWRLKDGKKSVAILLAHKLSLLADLPNSKVDFKAGEMLRAYARHIELMQKRVSGLEMAISKLHKNQEEQNELLLSSNQKINALLTSKSWRYTAPLRAGFNSYRIIVSIIKIFREIVNRGNGCWGLLKRLITIGRREGLNGVLSKAVYLYRQASDRGGIEARGNDYKIWIESYNTLSACELEEIDRQISCFKCKPLISIIMPVYNAPIEFLEQAIYSVQNQLYSNWELCIVDDASTNVDVHQLLRNYSKQDSRIKVKFNEMNGHISAASNSALDLALGDYIALLDQDDLLSKDALYRVIKVINEKPDVALIYSDEDKVDTDGLRFDPYFKSDWNPDLFYSHNMFCHLGVYKRTLVNDIGGFRLGLEGAQDYDLTLRCIERIRADQIVHLPFVLYHWRVHSGSTAMSGDAKPYAMIAGARAINEHFHRTKVKGRVELIGHGYRPHYDLPDPCPLVSIIIPTRNAHNLVRRCIESIQMLSTYTAYEIILVDNGSDDAESIKEWQRLKTLGVRILRDDGPFNYSALNNKAAAMALGEVLILLNNDAEVIEPRWLEIMVSHALRPDIGPVGAKLLFPDRTIQHAGVVLGLGGLAGAAGHAHYKFPESSMGYCGRISLTSNFSAVTAACLAVRKELYLKVGGLDEENLRVAFNDVDFCLKLGELGYRCVYAPDAVLYHHESATRGPEDNPEKKARFKQESDWMRARWGALIDNDPYYSPNLTLEHADFSLAWPPRTKIVK